MSFFDLENELPGWLDGVINTHPVVFNEITSENVINQLDQTSLKSYHMVCADKGRMVIAGRQQHHIWKFEAPKGNIRAYGKYLEYNSISPILRFWIGIVVKDKTITLYLWFGNNKPTAIHNYLKSLPLDLEIEKKEYWYKEPPVNSKPVSDILTDSCGCGSPPLNEDELGKLKKEVTDAIRNLLDAVEQAVKNK
jgi:hypothetical protein